MAERQRVVVPVDLSDANSELVEGRIVRDVREVQHLGGRPRDRSLGLEVELPGGRVRFYPLSLIRFPDRAA